jgi:hypothetical protein
MKNRKFIYTLLFAAVVIWSLIFYKLIFHSKKNPSTEILQDNKIIYSEKDFIEDTFELLLNYQDPFLKNKPLISHNEKVLVEPEVAFTKLKKIEPLIWPVIYLKGTITNTEDATCMLSISNKILVLKKEEEYMGLKIEHIWKDSVQFSYKEQRKTFLNEN